MFKSKNKYKAIRSKQIDGRSFHSLKEGNDYLWLKSLQKEGLITDLECQVRYRIFVNDKHITDSIVDFRFKKGGKVVWYETKGLETDAYIIKKRLIYATLPPNEVYLINANEKQIRLA